MASLSEYMNARSLPPVQDWHPQDEFEFDIRIDVSGNWHHEGRLIKRSKLVRLFSSILRKDGESYFLVTPQTRYKIKVDDVPFFASNMETSGQGQQQQIAFVTNVDDYLPFDQQHPVLLEDHGLGVKPYILVRGGMQALLARSVYYHLADLCIANPQSISNKNTADTDFGVWSNAQFFILSETP